MYIVSSFNQVNVLKMMSSFKVEIFLMRGEWKSVRIMSGIQCAVMFGISVMRL